MSKMSQLYLEIQETEVMLENLSIAELRSLRPAYNPYVEQIIEKLLIEKEYEQTVKNDF